MKEFDAQKIKPRAEFGLGTYYKVPVEDPDRATKVTVQNPLVLNEESAKEMVTMYRSATEKGSKQLTVDLRHNQHDSVIVNFGNSKIVVVLSESTA